MGVLWGYGVDGVADRIPEGLDGACCGLFQESLDLGEGHLDRVEVGTVGRQEQDVGARGLDGLADGDGLVGRQVVEDDDVARPQGRGARTCST